MRGLDTCLDLNVRGFSLRGSSSVFLSDRALFVTAELRLELPDQNSIIKDSAEGKFGMYTRFIEFANYRIPLSKFLLCVLEYYQINLSQLSVIGTVKDPLPVDEAVDLPCVELLNENCKLIRKYPKTVLCLVGLSRSLIKTDVRPTLLYDNDDEMDLLDFVKSADPFKVKVREWTLADNEVPLNTKTEDRVISPSAQTISLVDHTIQDELNVNSGKQKKRVAFVSGSSPAKKARAEGIVIFYSRPSTASKSPSALRRLSRQNEQADTGFGSAAPATEDVTFSVTPTPEHVLEDASHDNVRTHPPSSCFVVLSSGYVDTDIPVSPQVVSPVTSALTGVSAPVVESVGDDSRSSGSGPQVRLCPLHQVRHDAAFFDVVNINSAQHVCMISELHLRYEHEFMTRENFEKKFTDTVAIVKQRDAKIADLKAQLEKSEAKDAEVIELRKRVSDLEAMVAIKVDELVNFHTENVGLVETVFALESKRDGLKNQVVGEGKMREQFVSQQDATEQHFTKRVAELDARIADVRRDMDNDLYPHMWTAMLVGDGLLGMASAWLFINVHAPLNVISPWAGRSLALIKAYDPEVEGKYVVAVSEFKGVSFPLLDELESLKDSPYALIMFALIRKDHQDCEMLLSDAIPTIRQFVERMGLCSPSSSASGGISGLAPFMTLL
nr:hypothetical protein [Tanacetum cinerariifolium]